MEEKVFWSKRSEWRHLMVKGLGGTLKGKDFGEYKEWFGQCLMEEDDDEEERDGGECSFNCNMFTSLSSPFCSVLCSFCSVSVSKI